MSVRGHQFSHASTVPPRIKESWNLRALCQVGSVLPKAVAVGDVNGDGEEEIFIGTSEGSLMVLKHTYREPLFHCTSLTTVSVVLWEPTHRCLIVVCLEGTCHLMPNFTGKAEVEHDRFKQSAAIPSNCSSGDVVGDKLFLGSSNRRVYVFRILYSTKSPTSRLGPQGFSHNHSPDYFVPDLVLLGSFFVNSPIFSVACFSRCNMELLLVASTSGALIVQADDASIAKWNRGTIDYNEDEAKELALWTVHLRETRSRLAHVGTPTPTAKNRFDSLVAAQKASDRAFAFQEKRLPIAVDSFSDEPTKTTYVAIASEDGFVGLYRFSDHTETSVAVATGLAHPHAAFATSPNSLGGTRANPRANTGGPGSGRGDTSFPLNGGQVDVHCLWETRLDPLIQRVLVTEIRGGTNKDLSACVITSTTSGEIHVIDQSFNVLYCEARMEMISMERGDKAIVRRSTSAGGDGEAGSNFADPGEVLTLVCQGLDEVTEIIFPCDLLGVPSKVDYNHRICRGTGSQEQPGEFAETQRAAMAMTLMHVGLDYHDEDELLELADWLFPRVATGSPEGGNITGESLGTNSSGPGAPQGAGHAGFLSEGDAAAYTRRSQLQKLLNLVQNGYSGQEWDALLEATGQNQPQQSGSTQVSPGLGGQEALGSSWRGALGASAGHESVESEILDT